ncbi:phosphonate C-P lyase system protein PhnG [Peptoniphilus rhinitidis]|uniref:phosphonate C-P lyase system protein PhnG n=1 Tax=Peptoniphilus rhinitidis TaxID=1175452 RepID=UPI000289C242|nr:phosphonate C-P lyase system protein PhnG [Peptoniphilus rhinitidis]
MDKKERTKIFIEYAQDEVKEFAKEVSEIHKVEIIQEPREGLAMIKVREAAKNSLFYLGELLITECKVRIDDQVGIGIVRGSNYELSKALAIADSAFELNLPICEKYIDIFFNCKNEGLKKLNKKDSIIANTRVNFNIMNE